MPKSATGISVSVLKKRFIGGQLEIERRGKALLCGEISEIWGAEDGFLYVRLAWMRSAKEYAEHEMPPRRWEQLDPIPAEYQVMAWRGDSFRSARRDGKKMRLVTAPGTEFLIFHPRQWPRIRQRDIIQSAEEASPAAVQAS